MKTRLNKTHREMLLDSAIEKNQPTKEIKAEEKAYQSFLKEFNRCYEKEIPLAEMNVLKKHGQTKKRHRVSYTVISENGSHIKISFDIKEEDKIDTPYEQSCWSYPILFEAKSSSRLHCYFNKWEESKETVRKTKCKIKSDFEALINGARTFEDVVDIWKGANALKNEICVARTTAIISTETVERLKAYK